MAEIDDILKKLNDEQPSISNGSPKTKGITPPKENDSKLKSWVADNVTLLVIGVVAILILFGGYRMYHKAQMARIEEQQQFEKSNNSINAKEQSSKEKEKEAEFLLSPKEYQDNIDYLVKQDIGLIEDKDKGMKGILQFSSGQEIVLSYTRKDGVLHTINSKQEAVSHSNKWVRTLIAKLKAKDSIEKEQEKNKDNEK